MEAWQIILLAVYAGIAILDSLAFNAGLSKPVVAGAFAGLVMGDLSVGLTIGATLTLMSLGVGTYGGASVPDYLSGALIGTAFAVTSGSTEIGLAVAVPVGVLLVQIDVLARFCNTAFQNMAEAGARERNINKVKWGVYLGAIPWSLSRAIPVALCLVLGQDIVTAISEAAPDWLLNGFDAVADLLPAVGIAILLHYMPLKTYWMYAVIGFVCSAYIGLDMVGVALVGLFFAALYYYDAIKKPTAAPVTASIDSGEGYIDGDE